MLQACPRVHRARGVRCARSASQLCTPARCAHPARYALRPASREDVACVCPLPCRAGETLSSMHARHAVGIQRSSAARGIRRAHRDFGAPPSRHLHHDLGGNHTARLSKVPVVRVAPACSSASTTLASHAFMLVLRAVKERDMWLSGCRTGGEDVACICTLPCRAGETLSSMHARSTRDMLWLLPCAHAAAQQGAFGDAPRHPASAGRARGEDGGAPRTSTRRGRRPAWRGRRHDFPLVLARRAVHSCADPFASDRSAQRQQETCHFGMQDGHRLCPDLPETFEA